MKPIRSYTERIENTLIKFDSLKSTGEILWYVKSDDKKIGFTYGEQHKPFFIASATKLYVTAILSQLRSERIIDWDLPIHYYLPEIDLSNLSRWRGVDHGNYITIRLIKQGSLITSKVKHLTHRQRLKGQLMQTLLGN